MNSDDPSTEIGRTAKKPHKDRTKKELYLTTEFDGASMHDKALAKAGLAHRDFGDRMKITAAGSFLVALFGTVAGLLIGQD